MLKKSFLAILVLVLSGCTTLALTEEEARNADYGTYPSNYKEIVEKWFYLKLKDPDSAKFEYTAEPQKAYTRDAPITGGKPLTYGYVVYVSVNGKNSDGNYVGWERYRLLIRDGAVYTEITPNHYFSEPWYR